MIQIVLRDPAWRDRLADNDRRGPSALFWTHVNLDGRFELDMDTRLDLELARRQKDTSDNAPGARDSQPSRSRPRYKGYHFRSRLEARWAVFFDISISPGTTSRRAISLTAPPTCPTSRWSSPATA
jgi:hypothetical protein